MTPTDLPMPGEGIAILSSAKQTITKIGLDSCAAKLLSPGTVLFSSRATIGKLGIITVPMATNQGFVNLSPKPGITSRFLAYSLWNRIDRIKGLAGSTTFKEVSRGNIKKFRLAVPPLPEQEHIVGILDATEELRRSREQADRRTADLIPALFHQMFGDPATNTKGWQVVKVEAIAERVTKGTTPTTLGKTFSETGVPFLRAENLQNGTIDLSQGSLFIDEETDELLSRSRIRENDVLISIAGTIGRMAVTPSSTGHMNCNQAVAIVRPLGKVIPVFLMHCLASAAIQRKMMGATVTGTISNLSLGQIKQVQIPLPPLPLQRDFAARIAGIRVMESGQAASRRRLDDLFQSLLHRAFRGDL